MANSIQGIKEGNRLIVLIISEVQCHCIEQTPAQNCLQIK